MYILLFSLFSFTYLFFYVQMALAKRTDLWGDLKQSESDDQGEDILRTYFNPQVARLGRMFGVPDFKDETLPGSLGYNKTSDMRDTLKLFQGYKSTKVLNYVNVERIDPNSWHEVLLPKKKGHSEYIEVTKTVYKQGSLDLAPEGSTYHILGHQTVKLVFKTNRFNKGLENWVDIMLHKEGLSIWQAQLEQLKSAISMMYLQSVTEDVTEKAFTGTAGFLKVKKSDLNIITHHATESFTFGILSTTDKAIYLLANRAREIMNNNIRMEPNMFVSDGGIMTFIRLNSPFETEAYRSGVDNANNSLARPDAIPLIDGMRAYKSPDIDYDGTVLNFLVRRREVGRYHVISSEDAMQSSSGSKFDSRKYMSFKCYNSKSDKFEVVSAKDLIENDPRWGEDGKLDYSLEEICMAKEAVFEQQGRTFDHGLPDPYVYRVHKTVEGVQKYAVCETYGDMDYSALSLDFCKFFAEHMEVHLKGVICNDLLHKITDLVNLSEELYNPPVQGYDEKLAGQLMSISFVPENIPTESEEPFLLHSNGSPVLPFRDPTTGFMYMKDPSQLLGTNHDPAIVADGYHMPLIALKKNPKCPLWVEEAMTKNFTKPSSSVVGYCVMQFPEKKGAFLPAGNRSSVVVTHGLVLPNTGSLTLELQELDYNDGEKFPYIFERCTSYDIPFGFSSLSCLRYLAALNGTNTARGWSKSIVERAATGVAAADKIYDIFSSVFPDNFFSDPDNLPLDLQTGSSALDARTAWFNFVYLHGNRNGMQIRKATKVVVDLQVGSWRGYALQQIKTIKKRKVEDYHADDVSMKTKISKNENSNTSPTASTFGVGDPDNPPPNSAPPPRPSSIPPPQPPQNSTIDFHDQEILTIGNTDFVITTGFKGDIIVQGGDFVPTFMLAHSIMNKANLNDDASNAEATNAIKIAVAMHAAAIGSAWKNVSVLINGIDGNFDVDRARMNFPQEAIGSVETEDKYLRALLVIISGFNKASKGEALRNFAPSSSDQDPFYTFLKKNAEWLQQAQKKLHIEVNGFRFSTITGWLIKAMGNSSLRNAEDQLVSDATGYLLNEIMQGYKLKDIIQQSADVDDVVDKMVLEIYNRITDVRLASMSGHIIDESVRNNIPKVEYYVSRLSINPKYFTTFLSSSAGVATLHSLPMWPCMPADPFLTPVPWRDYTTFMLTPYEYETEGQSFIESFRKSLRLPIGNIETDVTLIGSVRYLGGTYESNTLPGSEDSIASFLAHQTKGTEASWNSEPDNSTSNHFSFSDSRERDPFFNAPQATSGRTGQEMKSLNQVIQEGKARLQNWLRTTAGIGSTWTTDNLRCKTITQPRPCFHQRLLGARKQPMGALGVSSLIMLLGSPTTRQQLLLWHDQGHPYPYVGSIVEPFVEFDMSSILFANDYKVGNFYFNDEHCALQLENDHKKWKLHYSVYGASVIIDNEKLVVMEDVCYKKLVRGLDLVINRTKKDFVASYAKNRSYKGTAFVFSHAPSTKMSDMPKPFMTLTGMLPHATSLDKNVRMRWPGDVFYNNYWKFYEMNVQAPNLISANNWKAASRIEWVNDIMSQHVQFMYSPVTKDYTTRIKGEGLLGNWQTENMKAVFNGIMMANGNYDQAATTHM